MHPIKRPAQIGRAGYIVDAVQTADTGVDGAVQIQLLHGLLEKDRGFSPYLSALFRSHGQHILRLIHADHLVTPFRQQTCHLPCPTGQIQHGMNGNGAFLELLFDIIRPPTMVHVSGKGIVPGRQGLIAAHSSSCSYLFRISLARGSTFL